MMEKARRRVVNDAKMKERTKKEGKRRDKGIRMRDDER